MIDQKLIWKSEDVICRTSVFGALFLKRTKNNTGFYPSQVRIHIQYNMCSYLNATTTLCQGKQNLDDLCGPK